MAELDAVFQIRMQVMWNRLISVVEEQAQTLMRTAFCTATREGGDLSAGVFDPKGRMIAQAVTGTAGHVNSMANGLKHFLRKYPIETMEDGDHYLTNDPWIASGHLHDFMIVTPCFYQGRLVALGGVGSEGRMEHRVIRIWDLESADAPRLVQVLDPEDEQGNQISEVEFTPDGRLISLGGSGLRLWDLQTETYEMLRKGPVGDFDLSRDGRTLVSLGKGAIIVHDLVEGSSHPLEIADGSPTRVAIDSTGLIVATAQYLPAAPNPDGVLSVGPVTGGERHLLLGHEAGIKALAISPDGRWIASASDDGTVRLWSMPEGKPFHTLPFDQFLARLKTLTNERIGSINEEGGTPEYAPFEGWQTLPTW